MNCLGCYCLRVCWVILAASPRPNICFFHLDPSFFFKPNRTWRFHQKQSVFCWIGVVEIMLLFFYVNLIESVHSLKLVGGLEHFLCSHILGTSHHPNWRTHIFQRGSAQPPTSKWMVCFYSSTFLLRNDERPSRFLQLRHLLGKTGDTITCQSIYGGTWWLIPVIV